MPIDNETLKVAERYATICNLIEALWLKRLDDDYYEIDLEELPALTSPQARKLATFIVGLFDED